MPSFPVKFFHSDMEGAPVLDNNMGRVTALLDACLINGFGTRTVSSITRSGSTVTVTFSASHAYVTDSIIRISGCDQTEYNSDWRITSTTLNSFTFDIGIATPVTPATGTISCKIPGIEGWQIYFNGTGTWNVNRRAYRSTNSSSTKPVLYIDDGYNADTVTYPAIPQYNPSYTKKAKVFLAEDMFDIDNFKGAYAPYTMSDPKRGFLPTGTGSSIYDGWLKWIYARNDTSGTTYDYDAPAAGNRKWFLVGDDRGFYFMPACTPSTAATYYGKGLYKFGEVNSYKFNDKYNGIITGSEMYYPANQNYTVWKQGQYSYPWSTLNATGTYMLREYHQQGLPIAASFTTYNPANTTGENGRTMGLNWPNNPNYGLVLAPSYVFNSGTSSLRGLMPGEYWVLNNTTAANNINDYTVFSNVTGYSGRKFIVVGHNNNTTALDLCKTAFDITGPWW